MLQADPFAAQRGTLVLWVPVALACGIGLYFQLRFEPTQLQVRWLAGLSACLFLLGLWARVAGPVFLFMAFVGFGVALASVRTHSVAAPVLKYRTYGVVEGRLIAMDRSISDVPRLTLDQVNLPDYDGAVPARVRVSLHGAEPSGALQPGMRLRMTANLSPPSGPVEPGGFDFQRHAWFAGLGAVGYTRASVEVVSQPQTAQSVTVLRHRFARFLKAQVGGEAGGFAAAILAGERSDISRDRLEDLRGSNLAHLLAISGLHMGLLTGVVFGFTRAAIALWPAFGLRLNGKKIAAFVALLAAAGYLVLSGAHVATQRAFIQVAVMLVAVMLDRRAITLRSVALAAILVLLIEPESLVEPGFQMSFSATAALVAIFSALQRWPESWPSAPKWLQPVVGTAMASLIAGLATAPYSAAHFNQIAQYGLLANLLAVPVMGTIVIPSAVLGLVLTPIGLGQVGYTVMGWGIDWILFVAHWVSSLNGAIWPVVTPGDWVLPVISVGGLWVLLWRGRWRAAGVLPCLFAVWMWSNTERPVLLIAETGGLFGLLSDQGRALSKPRGDGFAARSWLENDGDRALPDQAHLRLDWGDDPDWQEAQVLGHTVIQLKGRGWKERLDTACRSADWLIVAHRLRQLPQGKCSLLDQRTLSRTGAIAVYDQDGQPRFKRANDGRAGRPWAQ